VLKNFYFELAEGRRKFKDILMKKYGNILSCEQNFLEMTEACDSLAINVVSLHDSLQVINQEYFSEIASKLQDL